MSEPLQRALILLLLLISALPQESLAQNPEQQARIAFKAGKLALERGQPKVALEKFESVLDTLGPFPEVLYYAGKAAFESGEIQDARKYVEQCFELGDSDFERTKEGELLYELAAEIELGGERSQAPLQAAASVSPSDLGDWWSQLISEVIKTPWYQRCDDGLGVYEVYTVFKRTGETSLQEISYVDYLDPEPRQQVTVRSRLHTLEVYEGEILSAYAPTNPVEGQMVLLTRTSNHESLHSDGKGGWTKSTFVRPCDNVFCFMASAISSADLLEDFLLQKSLCPFQPTSTLPEFPLP